MNYSRVCATLVWRGIAHRLNRIFYRPAPPRSITITVTRKCNSRCIMCNIWRLGEKRDELSVEVITDFLSSRNFSRLTELDLTGGEPFLRKDLTELVTKIVRLRGESMRSLKTLALASNGLEPELVQRRVARMLEVIEGRFDVALVCSLDGIAEKHDAIRGIPGAYHRSLETIGRLQELASGPYPFWLGIKTTILPMNWDQIPALMQFTKEKGLFHIISPVLFTRERFRNLDRRDELNLLTKFREEMVRFYADEKFSDCYYAYLMTRMLEKGRRTAGCTAAMDHFFVEGDGRVFPCPMISLPFGSIRTETLDEILSSKRRAAFAAKAGRHDACRLCSEPGCIRFSQAGEAFTFFRFLLGVRRRVRFRQACYGEGLVKYFE